MDIVKEHENIALSDKQLLNLINGRADIVLYPDLHRYRNLDELLGRFQAAIILYCSKPRYGHWCCIFKMNPNQVEFFDSYGGIVDSQRKFIPERFKEESNQNY